MRFSLRYGSTIVHMGEGAIGGIADRIATHGKVLIVTGRRSARESGALGDATKLMERLGVTWELYDGVFPNPADRVVDGIADVIRDRGSEAVLAIGGGSVVDSAKFAAVVACSGGRAEDYLLGRRRPSCDLPVYAVNLTHGTGSEVDRYSVASIQERGLKIGIETTYPRESVDDPLYATSLSADHTRYTSIDALYHALESSTSTASNPMTVSLARDAASLVSRWLPAALRDPRDAEARMNLLYGAAIAGISIDNSVTHIVHLLEHVLSGVNPGLPHGAGLAFLGPRCIRYTYAARPAEGAQVLRALDAGLMPIPEHAARAEDALRKFQEEVGIDGSLLDYGFSRDGLESLTSRAMEIVKEDAGLIPFDVKPEIVSDILSSALDR